jgi:hypothetical protein
MIRRVLGIRLSDRISNESLYNRCGIIPASIQVIDARWRLFGHTLRMNECAPARKAMAYYFIKDHKGRQGNRVSIASVLSSEYEALHKTKIKTEEEYQAVLSLAQDRVKWRDEVVSSIVAHYHAKYFNRK